KMPTDKKAAVKKPVKKGDSATKAKRVPAVPETALKGKKAAIEARAKRLRLSVLRRRKERQKRMAVFKKAEKYQLQYESMAKSELQKARQAKKHSNFYVPAEAKVAFVVRIRGINGLHPKPRKILQLFRMRQINNGVFLKLNKATSTCCASSSPTSCGATRTSSLSGPCSTSAALGASTASEFP
ncbi:hypothetical protein BOX15_Mlig033608g2, partial [Macrostomum lignano]